MNTPIDPANKRYIPTKPLRPGLGRAEGGATPTTGTGGRTDDIEALLSEGEYVMDAESVALLGDGSTEAGFRKLDELRQNLRKHKGAALAKGDISPDSKPAEAYMAKGGRIMRVIEGGMPKRSVEERMSELDALRRLVETHKMMQKKAPGPSANDPYNSNPYKKASGGAVEKARARIAKISDYAKKTPVKKGGDPVAQLVSFADRLEDSLSTDNRPEFEASMTGIETMLPGLRIPIQKEMAKGGPARRSIATALMDWLWNASGKGNEELVGRGASGKIDRGVPLMQPAISQEDAVRYLEALDPNSDTLRKIKEYASADADRDILTKIREERARAIADHGLLMNDIARQPK